MLVPFSTYQDRGGFFSSEVIRRSGVRPHMGLSSARAAWKERARQQSIAPRMTEVRIEFIIVSLNQKKCGLPSFVRGHADVVVEDVALGGGDEGIGVEAGGTVGAGHGVVELNGPS